MLSAPLALSLSMLVTLILVLQVLLSCHLFHLHFIGLLFQYRALKLRTYGSKIALRGTRTALSLLLASVITCVIIYKILTLVIKAILILKRK
jgi:hypothetical protein